MFDHQLEELEVAVNTLEKNTESRMQLAEDHEEIMDRNRRRAKQLQKRLAAIGTVPRERAQLKKGLDDVANPSEQVYLIAPTFEASVLVKLQDVYNSLLPVLSDHDFEASKKQ